MSIEKLEVVCPLGEPATPQVPSASRINDLNGKTICHVSNGQFQADVVLTAVGDLIRERFPGAKIIPFTEFPLIRATADTEVRLTKLKEVLQQSGADAIITSTGA